jgi:hypothetical protein
MQLFRRFPIYIWWNARFSHSPIYFSTMLEGIRFQLNMHGSLHKPQFIKVYDMKQCIDIVCWKHVSHTDLYEYVKFEWHLIIHMIIFHSSTHLSMCQICFNAWNLCVNVQTYECMNFEQFSLLICHILNLWDVITSQRYQIL